MLFKKYVADLIVTSKEVNDLKQEMGSKDFGIFSVILDIVLHA